jgi:argininosuccinate lyase/amino-acid N-acetyltransferase
VASSQPPATPGTPEVWRGRLGSGLDPRAQALNDSLKVDGRLWPEELMLTRAYGQSLREAGVLTAEELGQLVAAANALEGDLGAGITRLEGEDVHSAVEAELTRRCGDPARKLHTGRSRNDQVATLLRLRVIALCEEAVEGIRDLERALVMQAQASGDQAVAAYTHLQPAQPVLLAHWWLAHVAAFERDEERFKSASQCADQLPLGAGAVAGTPLHYDRAALATRLGFSRLADNSLDAVGDRDFAFEYLNAAAALAIHLSRMAEDLVLWCSPGFGWYGAPEGFSTGSSLLPQKKNPDLFELARGKSGRLIANAERLAIVLKGLPSAYQKDLQEDKEAVFDTGDTLATLLGVLPAAITALRGRSEKMDASLSGDLLAVELADALVAEGVPFREAHAAVGRLWAAAERAGVTPAALPETERLSLSPLFTSSRLTALDVDAALARRNHLPGAGPESVAEQLKRHEARLGLGPAIEPAHTVEAGTARAAGTPAGAAPAGMTPIPAGPGGAPISEMLADGTLIRRARLADVPAIAAIMAEYVMQGVLLPRPVSELYQCVREFVVAERPGENGAPEIVACAALRVLWDDVGEVRTLAVRPDHHGRGLGGHLVAHLVADARAFGLPRVIALTREVPFFERCGFVVVPRETLPRKVWTDCVRCPKRHACDEVAVVLDLVPGATAAAEAAGREFTLSLPQLDAQRGASLPIVS